MKMIFQGTFPKNNTRLKKRRGVTDVISTMLLMAVTVTGATTLTYFVNDGFVSGNLGSVSTSDSSSLNLLLLAYDTRDSASLLMMNDVDNENIVNSFLCGVTCSSFSNAIPENGGTEFIVLQVQNNGINPIFLQDISINGVVHSWDSSTSGISLDASQNDLIGGKYPSDGMFSIVPISQNPLIQNDDIQIQNGQIVNLLIKLGSDDADITLNKGIHIFLNVGAIQPIEFFIESGDAR
ncbi:hypothetical protein NKOR_05295 [Candidatus Nitrosopumilus koreensis AR1]|uniref:Uncharacterized protein n=1 Tax=Candidatus Nitrosopumilus koreensis AR1 TaxID=1229908 RepID=K0B7P0_9ARCH|nr:MULTISPECIES: hypothetical protein [Nitrosopumilus]AFS80945.1 hypothetical protein NKOR_05295 [Candidatus Nitrosopumilus koreensis AR1]